MNPSAACRCLLAALLAFAGLARPAHSQSDGQPAFVAIVALPPLPDGLAVDLGDGVAGTLRGGALFGPVGLKPGKRTLTVRHQPEDKTHALDLKPGEEFLLLLGADPKEGIAFRRIDLPKKRDDRSVLRLPGTGEAVWMIGKDKLEPGGKPVPCKESFKVVAGDGKTVVEYEASEPGLYLLVPGPGAVSVVLLP